MRFLKNLLFLFISNNSFLTANIVQAESFSEIENLWENLSDSSLVIFDIDDVIVSTEDHFAHPYGYIKFVELTNHYLGRALSEQEKTEIMRRISLSQLLAKRNLVEKNIPLLIQDLQNKGIKVIALTNFPRGEYGAISRVETWRIEYLRSLGIDFSFAFPQIGSYELKKVTKEGFAPPLYEEGILFANSHPKGDVLDAFFQTSGFMPSEVIFIDDMLHNHDSVHLSLKKMQVGYKGVHYLGAKKFFTQLNEDVLDYQIDHLIKTENWLNDQQVLDLLE